MSEETLAQEQARLEKDGFSRYNGFELEIMEQDRVVYRLDIGRNSLNPYGMVHGGALYTMADDAAGVAIHTDGRHYVTQTGTLHFLSNRPQGVIRAEGRVRRRGKQGKTYTGCQKSRGTFDSLSCYCGVFRFYGFTRIHVSPARARSTRASTSRTASAFRTSSRFGRVAGCRGVNTVQQSS